MNRAGECEEPVKTYEKIPARKIKELDGWKTYKSLCADCHGKKGDGKGPLGETMSPSPANYQDCNILSKITDADIKKVIMEETASIGKSKAMQEFNKNIKDPKVLDQLIGVIRSFGGCNYNAEAPESR